MEYSIFYKNCHIHKQELVAFDLNPLANLEDKFLCMKCLTNKSKNQQLILIPEAMEKFKDMKLKEFEKIKEKKLLNCERLQQVLNKYQEIIEFFNNKLREHIKIVNLKIQEEETQIKNLKHPKLEICLEQDVVDLSYYINFGFKNNLLQENPNKYEYISIIQQSLKNLKLENKLSEISQLLEVLESKIVIDEVKQSELPIMDQKQPITLNFNCQQHESQIIMANLQPGQQKKRLYCLKCIEESQDKLTSLSEVNKLWQNHSQIIYENNKKFLLDRQQNQDKIFELMMQFQKYDEQFSSSCKFVLENQSNKIRREIENLKYSYNSSKQLIQMEQQEIEKVICQLSQDDRLQEMQKQQNQQILEDNQYKVNITSIVSSFYLQFSNNLSSLEKLCNLNSIEHFNSQSSQINQQFQIFQETLEYTIVKVKTKLEHLEKLNPRDFPKGQLKNEISQYEAILKELNKLQKFQTNHDNLKINSRHINKKFSIRNNKQFTINKLQSNYFNVLQMIEQLKRFKEQSLKFSQNCIFSPTTLQKTITAKDKMAQSSSTQQIQEVCLCEQPIPRYGVVSVNFKINQLYDIMIGICKKNVIRKDFIVDNLGSVGHGFYVLYHSQYLFSHHDSQKNNQADGFQFSQGDVINVEVNLETRQISWRNKTKLTSCSLEFQPSEDLYFCCIMHSWNRKLNEVQIV